MIIYTGKRDKNGARVFVAYEPEGATVALPHVVLHSPTGLEWGYGGSGPADTALSILAHHLNEHPTREDLRNGNGFAVKLYQDFKWAFIAGAPAEGFEISEVQIADWLKKQEKHDNPAGS